MIKKINLNKFKLKKKGRNHNTENKVSDLNELIIENKIKIKK
jgi:hypothetical protein